MNKLKIRNVSSSSTAFQLEINGIDFGKMSNHVEIIFDAGSLPVLRIDVPLTTCDIEVDDCMITFDDVKEYDSKRLEWVKQYKERLKKNYEPN